MTDVATPPSPAPPQPPLPERPRRQARLPRWAPALVALVALAAGALTALALGGGVVETVVFALIGYAVALPLWSRLVENARAAKDRLVTTLVWTALGIALVPLISLLFEVVHRGAPQLDGRFFTWSMRNVVGEPGGIYHAILGTLIITLIAALISVPVGLLTAIYLVEYGVDNTRRGPASRANACGAQPLLATPLSRATRFLVDVMTGIPSIVAGLFTYALFGIVFGPGTQNGLGGGVALSVLMIPIVVRSAEEMLKLVPGDLREAAYALGVPKQKTIVRVVLPTAASGITTGITLAVARVIGETAPLLIIAGATDSVKLNPFSGQMASLPVFIYSSYTQPGSQPEILQNMAWGAALVLILIVLVLNLLARLLGRVLAPSTGH